MSLKGTLAQGRTRAQTSTFDGIDGELEALETAGFQPVNLLVADAVVDEAKHVDSQSSEYIRRRNILGGYPIFCPLEMAREQRENSRVPEYDFFDVVR